jgi:methyl-accepting chemotaxis protein
VPPPEAGAARRQQQCRTPSLVLKIARERPIHLSGTRAAKEVDHVHLADVLERRVRAESAQRIDPEVIVEMADGIGETGLLVVEAASRLDSIAATFRTQVALFKELTGAAGELRQGNQSLVADASALARASSSVTAELAQSRGEMASAMAKVAKLTRWVESTVETLERLELEVQGVGQIVAHIDALAQQTHILALNAHIEAARAGKGATGFTVIASAIRALADQAIDAAGSISVTLGPIVDSLAQLGSTTKEARGTAERTTGALAAVDASLARSLGEASTLTQGVETVAAFSQVVNDKVELFSSSLDSLGRGVESSGQDLTATASGLEDLMERTNRLVQLSARTGVATNDSPYAELAIALATQVAERFESAISAGEITLEELFSERYEPVPGTNPPQYLTPWTELSDRLCQDLVERCLDALPGIAFACVVDRNAYLSTHNLRYSAPQGDDPIWNTAHSRNRRFFDDPTGLAAARNREPYLLQTYRRDMGGGSFVLMKDMASPIYVCGLHFGAVRIGYEIVRHATPDQRIREPGIIRRLALTDQQALLAPW